MPAANEKINFRLVARFMAMLLLLAAIAASAQARSAVENRVWQKSAPTTESLHFQPLQLLELHQVKGPVRWYDASGYTFAAENAGAPKVFKNQFPDDPVGPPLKTFRPSELLKQRFGLHDYIVTEDGELIIGQRAPGTGHIDLAQGKNVLAAGQVEVSGGKIVELDNASGHYLPKGPNAQSAALDAFRRNGFRIGDDVYVEKAWNAKAQAWEPVNAPKQ